MKKYTVLLLLLLATGRLLSAQHKDSIDYQLKYRPGDSHIEVTIGFNKGVSEKVALIIPRSAPGTYSLIMYDTFFDAAVATATDGSIVEGKKGAGSYYDIDPGDKTIASVSYSVDLVKMEDMLISASESSKVRDRYLGLLGYSVFGFVKGYEDLPIRLTIETASDWPVFSTIDPRQERKLGTERYALSNFAELADGQYLLGPDVRIWYTDEGPIPFYVSLYAEAEADIEEAGRKGLQSLQMLHDYFGFTPMPHYVMCLETLIPRSPKHNYGVWMEHMNSMTGTSDTTRAPWLSIMVHHMGHSWVPLRAYGEGYRPFAWEIAPLIETVWFNEGFLWYMVYHHILKWDDVLDYFKENMDQAPDFIRTRSLKELSLLGSNQYSEDFRIGRNLFSRGALLAHELDEWILEKSGGKKSFKDAFMSLYRWVEENQRGLRYEEIPQIMSEGTGIDLLPIWEKWQAPPAKE